MNKLMARAAALLLAMLILAGTTPALAKSYTGTVNKDKVFFRSRANTSSVWHAQLNRGTKVTVTGVRGDFYAVEYDKKNGYIMRSLVDLPSSALRGLGVEGKTSQASKYDKVTSISGLGAAPAATRKGSSGDAVEKLQRALQIKGFLKGRVDGIYGEQTASAVSAFQKAAGLSQTGSANSATINSLFGKGGGSSNQSVSIKDDPGMKGITDISKITVPRGTRPGDSGQHVRALQQALKLKGYYKAAVDSSYGDLTTDAVKRFQRAHKLTADGIAGNGTLRALFGRNAGEAAYTTQRLDWKRSSGTIPQFASFTIKDVSSGLTFQARRWSGSNHLDAEPLTKKDAQTLKKIAGGAYSWARRAILVRYNGKVYAASMNTMPHDQETIKDNNYDGHFCIHFYNSKTHGTNRTDTAHQNAVTRAMKASW
ncbi:MAG: peptidoglycan-binding protein [Clostridiales bacterium]|nr:peptidoglycan-binding protein [Clostridiales bacterium]